MINEQLLAETIAKIVTKVVNENFEEANVELNRKFQLISDCMEQLGVSVQMLVENEQELVNETNACFETRDEKLETLAAVLIPTANKVMKLQDRISRIEEYLGID